MLKLNLFGKKQPNKAENEESITNSKSEILKKQTVVRQKLQDARTNNKLPELPELIDALVTVEESSNYSTLVYLSKNGC
jgi:hypothetical protein